MTMITVKVDPDALAAMQVVKEMIADSLLVYSEWLDADQRLFKKLKKHDYRTHEDLVNEFIEVHSV